MYDISKYEIRLLKFLNGCADCGARASAIGYAIASDTEASKKSTPQGMAFFAGKPLNYLRGIGFIEVTETIPRMWKITTCGQSFLHDLDNGDMNEPLESSNDLTQDRLKTLLTYNPDTGKFFWLPKPGSSLRADFWNKKLAGNEVTNHDASGYARATIYGRMYLAHRLAFLYMLGHFPPKHVDHINGDPGDNRWVNLRMASTSENMRNRALSKSNKSGVMGVVWNKSVGKWMAQIKTPEKTIYLGTFANIEDAAIARKAAEREHGFHENHGRPRINLEAKK